MAQDATVPVNVAAANKKFEKLTSRIKRLEDKVLKQGREFKAAIKALRSKKRN